MLSERVAQLLRDIYADEGNTEIRQKLQENPEELLISLLEQIKEEIPIVSATLRDTVERGASGVLESVKQRRAAKERVKA